MRFAHLLKEMQFSGNMVYDLPLGELTTMRVGGPCAAVVFPTTTRDVEMVSFFCAERGVDLTIIGRGSNLVVRDGGLNGMAMVLRDDFAHIDVRGNRLIAQAGASMTALSRAAQRAGLSGLAFAEGIPGSVGGGIYMNAGAYGGEVAQVLHSALVLTREQELVELSAAELRLGYRHSALMENGATLIEGRFLLAEGEREQIDLEMRDYNARRREKQPLEYASCGSFFKRPQGFFAGKLIEDAGLKGESVGDAQISQKHAGFLINKGNATAKDVVMLMQKVQRRVMDASGVWLEPEPRFIGEE